MFRETPCFKTMNSVGLYNLRLKFKMFTPSRCKNISIRKFDFVAKKDAIPLKLQKNYQKKTI